MDVRATPAKKPGSNQVDLPGSTTFGPVVIHTLTCITISFCFAHIPLPLLLFHIPVTTTNIAHNNTIIACLNVFSLVHGIQRVAQESDEASV